ncbi:MAG: NAD(P)/FAD-dependent oxidoreductase [Nocardia sp.]|uniref:flavin-containing monooxygenase n=1 Tax=Nocardia sp. TaxID=1821 RepID=UPI00261D9890|nr:NAD(P)/FAD-dependent oxidoreductase [Nocardia sp.]MCU1648041.1 NAD(P)/FAD-dependent oxidoreductase [Nocardia sp.]
MSEERRSTPSVAIIGAGFGGIGAAIELERNGIHSYEVFEKGDSVGGVWRENTYPGAACDVPSSIYSYSFELKADWSATCGTQSEILDYLKYCAAKYGVEPKIRYTTEVVAATFVDDRWLLDLRSGEIRYFDALICATGLLSRPKIPDLDGMEGFAGAMFHSAEWDHSVSLKGKRAVVVGSGASAVQLLPEIVDDVAELAVVQRSPNWVINKHNKPRTAFTKRLMRKFPMLMRAEHNLEFLTFESRAPLIYRSLDVVRGMFQATLRRKIRQEIRDPELRATVTPDYLALCNRPLASSDWYPALDRAHVTVHRQAVRRVSTGGLELADGREIEADVIIWCTGFSADEYLAPIDITGRDGRKLHAEWKSGPEAYLGVAVSGYPNLFMIYGPGTGSSVNSVIFMLEKEARYARIALQHIASTGGWLDVRPEVQQDYNVGRQQQLQKTVYASGCPGWYSNEDGNVFAVWPGSHLAYARAIRTVDFRAYEHGGIVEQQSLER